MNITKQEIKDWINLLYKDLLNDDVYIGGYFFNFKQLKDFEKTKKKLDKQFEKKLQKKKSFLIQLLPLSKNSSCGGSNQAHLEHLDDLQNTIVKITTKNKFNEQKTFPCTEEEFYFVFNELEKAKLDVEQFKKFLLNELKSIKEDQYSDFMLFINDLLDDIRLKFTGKNHNVQIF